MTAYVIAAAVICACAVFLVLHCQYEDGLVGRSALAVMAIVEGIVVAEWLVDDTVAKVLPSTLAVQLCFAVFLLRHVYRFVRWRVSGEHDWRPARK